MNTIVARIDELRKIKGMTKTAMADKSGIPRSSINNWYYADAIPSLTNLELVCKTLDITVEQFFNGIDTVENKSEQEFLDEWRMLSNKEKALIKNVIDAFKAAKAVQND